MSAPELVLVIEDEAGTREGLLAALAAEGHPVEGAVDGPDGVRRARALDPGVVMVDLGLPGLDGFEVIRVLRAGRKQGRPYIIAVSGFTDARSRQLAFEAGCDEYVAKPAPLDALVAPVRAHAHRRGYSGLLAPAKRNSTRL